MIFIIIYYNFTVLWLSLQPPEKTPASEHTSYPITIKVKNNIKPDFTPILSIIYPPKILILYLKIYFILYNNNFFN